MRQIDHIVYAVPNLEQAIENFKNLTGVTPIFGGYHLTKGTKNAIVNLGDQCYLEILAVDPSNKDIAPPRWMGIDLIKNAQITRWSLKSSNLPRDSALLKQANQQLGIIQGGQRKTSNGKLLTWEMIIPLSTPAVDILPFMTDWQASETHPTEQLAPSCQLLDFYFQHPTPSLIQPVFNALGLNYMIQKGTTPFIQIQIKTPKGDIRI